MATTTNYGWTTPDDTALVKDGASAIRTLGSSVDTTTKNLNPETTLGDLAYRSSTANVKTRLGLGTAGQVLQVNSGATAPEWATPAGSAPASASNTVSTRQGTTSTSFTNLTTSGPAVTLTTGTKVLVILGAAFDSNNNLDCSIMDFDISGATTRSADATTGAGMGNYGAGPGNQQRTSRVTFHTVTAGSNTFTAKYKSVGTTNMFFADRNIIVIDLGS